MATLHTFQVGQTYIYEGMGKMILSWEIVSRTAGSLTMKNRTFGTVKRNISRITSVTREEVEVVRIFKQDKHSTMYATNIAQ